MTSAHSLDSRTIHVRQDSAWRGIFTWTEAVVPATDPVTYEPVDLTGYSAIFRWLSGPGGKVLLTVTSPDTEDGGIDLDLVNGVLTVHLCAEQTARLRDGNYQLDVVSITDDCEVVTVSAGYADLIQRGEAYPWPGD